MYGVCVCVRVCVRERERERQRERQSGERDSILNAQTVYYPICIFEL